MELNETWVDDKSYEMCMGNCFGANISHRIDFVAFSSF